MKKIFTILFAWSLTVLPMLAQEIDESYVFLDEEGEFIENGAVVLRNVVEPYEGGGEVIYSGISVLNQSGSSSDYIKMIYTIERIDNGTYQICFPSTCNMQTQPDNYETGIGQLMGDLQDIQSEWFPTADGSCVVTLSIETLTKSPGFPPRYDHLGYGPTVTLQFVKGGAPEPIKGDVNGDGEVNISDVNAMIDFILSSSDDPIADVNGDGEINISDVNEVISIILSGN